MQKPKQSNILQRIGASIALLASIATILALFYQTRENEPEAEIQLLSVDYLTQKNNIYGLESRFEFNHNKVSNLWLCKVAFVNTGNSTIITKGAKQNTIVENGFRLKFNPIYRIYQTITKVESDFNSSLVIIDSNTLEFQFTQWRPQEKSVFSFLISSDTTDHLALPFLEDRVIVNGDITVKDYVNEKPDIKRPLLDKLFSSTTTFINRILACILIAGLLVVTAILGFLYLFEWLKIFFWKLTNIEKFRTFILSDKVLNSTNTKLWDILYKKEDFVKNRSEYIEKPWTLPKSMWQEYDGKKLNANAPEISGWRSFFIWLVFSFLIMYLCVIALLAIIVR